MRKVGFKKETIKTANPRRVCSAPMLESTSHLVRLVFPRSEMPRKGKKVNRKEGKKLRKHRCAGDNMKTNR